MRRTDPMFYEFDIQEVATGEVKRVPIFCYWTGDASVAGLQKMCDCQLAPFFTVPAEDLNSWPDYMKGRRTLFYWQKQFDYLKAHACTHTHSAKYRVLAAYPPNADAVKIAA